MVWGMPQSSSTVFKLGLYAAITVTLFLSLVALDRIFTGEIVLASQPGIEFQVKLGRLSPTQGSTTFKVL